MAGDNRPVPHRMILLHHHVCPEADLPPSTDRAPLAGWRWNLTPDQFRAQLLAVARAGWRFVTLDEYVREAVESDRGPGRMATVTFDDGWLDNHTHALPVLRELGIPAAFFIVTGPMDGVDDALRMRPEHLRDMLAAGMTLGAHTRTHPNVAGLEPAARADEIEGSRSDLQALIGRRVDYFAYPGGRFNAAAAALLESGDWKAGFSVIPCGPNRRGDRWWLSRDVLPEDLTPLSARLRLWKPFRRLVGLKWSRRVRHRLGSAS